MVDYAVLPDVEGYPLPISAVTELLKCGSVQLPALAAVPALLAYQIPAAVQAHCAIGNVRTGSAVVDRLLQKKQQEQEQTQTQTPQPRFQASSRAASPSSDVATRIAARRKTNAATVVASPEGVTEPKAQLGLSPGSGVAQRIAARRKFKAEAQPEPEPVPEPKPEPEPVPEPKPEPEPELV